MICVQSLKLRYYYFTSFLILMCGCVLHGRVNLASSVV